jgi:D-alanyl-D-alanine carboxypeptidase/D-alanyl-D-alanine-endopeptidase (penicillin-binding protein 4)
LETKVLQSAHVGISIFEPATNKTWYDYQGDKYFVPASNTKLPTCYAAMKYLGDSLVGLRVSTFSFKEKGEEVFIKIYQPTGDPTFLHPDFKRQPVFDFLKNEKGSSLMFSIPQWKEVGLGSGWGWSDYMETYMAERSAFPLYGNIVRFTKVNGRVISMPAYFLDENLRQNEDDTILALKNRILNDKDIILRARGDNIFYDYPSTQKGQFLKCHLSPITIFPGNF